MLPYESEEEGSTVKHEFKGLFGMPLMVSAAHSLKVSDDTKFKANWKMGSHVEAHNKITHQINKNLKVKHLQHFYGERVGTSEHPYDIGFEFNYKL